MVSFFNRIKKRHILSLVLLVFICALIVVKIDTVYFIVGRFFGLLTPFFLGLLLAYILDRPVKFFSKLLKKTKFFQKHNPVGLAIVITYLLFLGVLIGLIFILIPSLRDSVIEFASNFGRYLNQFQNLINNLMTWLQDRKLDASLLESVNDKAGSLASDVLKEVPTQLSGFVSGAVSVVGNIMIGLLISIYLLSDKKRLLTQANRVIDALVKRDRRDAIHHVLSLTNNIFYDFFYIQLTESLITGVLLATGMAILGFPYPLMIATFCGVTAMVPVVGSYLGAAFGVVIMILVEPSKTIWFLLFFLVFMQFEANVIYPKRVAKSIKLPALWSIVSIILGGGMFGVVGALLAVPTASVLYQLSGEWLQEHEEQEKLELGSDKQAVRVHRKLYKKDN